MLSDRQVLGVKEDGKLLERLQDRLRRSRSRASSGSRSRWFRGNLIGILGIDGSHGGMGNSGSPGSGSRCQ